MINNLVIKLIIKNNKKNSKRKSIIKNNSRYSSLYQQWRRKCLQRDNYRCQVCGRKNIRLNVHHIKGYSKYPLLRTEISNGITLCSSCHYKFHKKYGKQNFPDIRLLIKQFKNKKTEQEWIEEVNSH